MEAAGLEEHLAEKRVVTVIVNREPAIRFVVMFDMRRAGDSHCGNHTLNLGRA